MEQSFGERHPILATIFILSFVIAGGIPAVAMVWPDEFGIGHNSVVEMFRAATR